MSLDPTAQFRPGSQRATDPTVPDTEPGGNGADATTRPAASTIPTRTEDTGFVVASDVTIEVPPGARPASAAGTPAEIPGRV